MQIIDKKEKVDSADVKMAHLEEDGWKYVRKGMLQALVSPLGNITLQLEEGRMWMMLDDSVLDMFGV